MTDTYVFAFLALLLIVGLVMMWVVWMARTGSRMATNPPTARQRRRVAQGLVAVGIFGLGFHAGAFVYGAEIRWLSVIVSIGLLGQGLFILREVRQAEKNEAAP